MKFLDKRQTLIWLEDRGFAVSDEGIKARGGLARSFAVPVDSGVRTGLAKELVAFFEDEAEALLFVHEWGIWPSSEDQNLFRLLRRGLGETSGLTEKPGHLFFHQDIADVASLVAAVLCFSWGAWLVRASGSVAIRISHDEYVDVFLDPMADAIPQLEALDRTIEIHGRKQDAVTRPAE